MAGGWTNSGDLRATCRASVPLTAKLTEIGNARLVSSVQLAAIDHLAQADAFARNTACDPWEFAVEMDTLLAEGCSRLELRRLVTWGYVEHGEETTAPNDAVRTFRRWQNLAFSPHTCFVLTPAGMRFADRMLTGARSRLRAVTPDQPVTAGAVEAPSWDSKSRVLRVGIHVVKRYRIRSPNQEAILGAFEEEGWPSMVYDPLPPHPEQDPKRRLHSTIQSLNRGHQTQLLQFRGDGTGEGVVWELRESPLAFPIHRSRFAA